MEYLNCPRCHLSIYQRPNDWRAKSCPRCSRHLGDASPLFSTPLPTRLLGAPLEFATSTSTWEHTPAAEREPAQTSVLERPGRRAENGARTGF